MYYKRKSRSFVVDSKEIGLEVNADINRFMVTSRD
jgi:hypothetical protein